MANKGVTQDQVNRAADALVTAGERPTVERIRAFLGSGSPNTVTRLLDVWWQELGTRLTAQQDKLLLPDAPESVVALASQWWEHALQTAQINAAAALESERSALAHERSELQNAQRAARTAEATAAAAIEAAHQAQALAEARLAECQRLIDQQTTQLADFGRQRDALVEQAATAEQTTQALRDRLQAQETAATAERDSLAQHMRTVEDRAHAEVDRAREEAKMLQREHAIAVRDHATARRASQQELKTAHTAAVEAGREAAREQARAQALEQQLAKLADLPAALEASLSRVRQAKPSAPMKRIRSKARAG